MLRSFKNRASGVFRKKKAADTEPVPDLPVPPSPADTSVPGPARYIPPPPPPPPYSQPSTSLYTPSTASTRPEQNQQEREQEQEQEQEQQLRGDHQQDQLLDQALAHQPPAPDPAAPDPFAPKYVPYIEATPLKNNMFAGTAGRYGRVNPDIMGGFGDDDDSIWLVDDEESDEEQRREQRNSQTRTSNSLRTPSRPVSRHSTASSSRTPATTQTLDSGPAPPSSSFRPAFRYHVPSLLDDDEFTSGTLSSTVATPETPPTQETSPAPRRGYGPVAPSILNLTDLGVDADDIHEPPSKRRNVTPLPTRPAVASSSSSSSLVNPYVARFQQPDDAKTPASLCQLDQSADDVADDFSFGQRYQKAPDSSDVIVTHQRIPAEASTGEVECLVCTETKGANAFPRFSITSSCTHPPSTCLDCIQLSIESDLSSKLWTEIRCPECRELLEYADIQRYANNQTFTRYETLALRAAMSEAENFIWCTSGCGSGQIHDSGSEQPIVTCLHCGHRSCFHHNVAWHQTLSCDEYDQLLADPENFRSNLEIENEKWSEAQRAQLEADRAMAQGLLAEDQAERRRQEERERKEREQAQKAAKLARQIAARRKREEEQSRATVSQTTKPCPGCGWAIEKNRGCSHMTCIKCRFEFCWACDQTWDRRHNNYCTGAA